MMGQLREKRFPNTLFLKEFTSLAEGNTDEKKIVSEQTSMRDNRVKMYGEIVHRW